MFRIFVEWRKGDVRLCGVHKGPIVVFFTIFPYLTYSKLGVTSSLRFFRLFHSAIFGRKVCGNART